VSAYSNQSRFKPKQSGKNSARRGKIRIGTAQVTKAKEKGKWHSWATRQNNKAF
jgi:ribosomal protein L7Ae-like RNA K-turn-binding protein